MGLLSWVVLGGLAGWIGAGIMGKGHRFGIFGNIVLGIVGAVLGGLIVNLLGGSGITGLNIYSILVAALGASVLIYISSRLS